VFRDRFVEVRLRFSPFGAYNTMRLPTQNKKGVLVSPQAAGCRRVVVLGSTGSIGTNCLDVIAHLPDRLEAVGLCAHTSWETLLEQAERFRPRWLAVTDPRAGREGR
jgi:hypothetical protein